MPSLLNSLTKMHVCSLLMPIFEEESSKVLSCCISVFHFCMQNSKQGINQTVRFPGLSLSLGSISNSLLEQGVAVTELLQGVGVASSNYCPTHLQFLQVVDYSTIPLFWISPLHCQLYPTQQNSQLLCYSMGGR